MIRARQRPSALALTALLLAASAVPARAQDEAAPAAPPPPCAAEEYRQFDFWLGEWEVRDANGSLQGTNTIASILNGCVLSENWEGTSGSIGRSYNAYDRQTGMWHQTWVDNAGTVLKIDGGLDGNAMVMRGSGRGRDGGPVDHRITWTPLEDGRVRQHWEISRDGGATWNDAFLGFYARREASD